MAAEPAHTVRILTADDHGVPTGAVCECGAWAWDRPDGDRWADSLVAGARAHRVDAAEREADRADAWIAAQLYERRRREAARYGSGEARRYVLDQADGEWFYRYGRPALEDDAGDG